MGIPLIIKSSSSSRMWWKRRGFRTIWGNACNRHRSHSSAHPGPHHLGSPGLSRAVGWEKQQVDNNYVKLELQFEIFWCLEQKWTKGDSASKLEMERGKEWGKEWGRERRQKQKRGESTLGRLGSGSFQLFVLTWNKDKYCIWVLYFKML